MADPRRALTALHALEEGLITTREALEMAGTEDLKGLRLAARFAASVPERRMPSEGRAVRAGH